MSLDPILITAIVIAAALILLISDRLRPDWVALTVMLLLGLTNVLTPQETFAGFSGQAVITILAVFILAEGLRRTGVADWAGTMLARLAGRDERMLALASMLSGATLSLVMNNIAAAVVLLPAISSAAKKAHARPGKLLIPLAFATSLGGMATLLTTTNIIVSSLLNERDLPGFGLLDFAGMGVFIVAAGILYMLLVGLRLLPAGPQEDLTSPSVNLLDIYNLQRRLVRCMIIPGSPLIGSTLSESNLREKFNMNLVSIERQGETISCPTPETIFQVEDILILEGKIRELVQKEFRAYFTLLPRQNLGKANLSEEDTIIIEAILAPRSTLIGSTLRKANFREKYNLNVLGIYRSGKPLYAGLSDRTLQFGDALLLHGQRAQARILKSEQDLIVLNGDLGGEPLQRKRSWVVLLILLATLGLAAIQTLSVAEVMLGGALLMILTGAITMDQAYRVIEWKTVFMIAGLLPLGTALTKTGIASSLAQNLIQVLGPVGPYALLAGLMILAILLCQLMHSGVVATIIAPIAIQIALLVQADPRAMSMGVALATSMTFMTPLGHPVNLLIMSPGGYRFKDYFRVGLPLTLILFMVILLLMPIFWPLQP